MYVLDQSLVKSSVTCDEDSGMRQAGIVHDK
jgi:hypothetical protein